RYSGIVLLLRWLPALPLSGATCVARRGRSPATIDSYRHGLLPAARGGRRWQLLAQPGVDKRWHQLHDATQGGGRNVRAAGGPPGVKVWRTPEESARDAQGAGGTETRRILACGRTPCQGLVSGEDRRVNINNGLTMLADAR